jgi:hypothetical protein
MRQYGTEFLGTFWLVLGGCGSAVLAAAFPGVGIGLRGVSLAHRHRPNAYPPHQSSGDEHFGESSPKQRTEHQKGAIFPASR